MHNRRDFIKTAFLSTATFVFAPWCSANTQQSSFVLWQLPSQSGNQMNSYVIQTVHGKIIVIDGGYIEDTSYLKGFLAALGNKVDIWFVSHQHRDHLGALTAILRNQDVLIDKIYGSMLSIQWIKDFDDRKGLASSVASAFNESLVKTQKQVIELELGQIIEIDGITFKILGVKNPEITVNGVNNSSVVMRAWDSQKSVLFLGDLGVEGGRKFLSGKYKKDLRSDYVQMAHHGQKGVGKAFYQIVSPKYCLWPTPKGLWDNDNGGGKNSGQWETLEVRSWMNEFGVRKHYIMKDGLQRIQ